MQNANEIKTAIEANGYMWGRDAWYEIHLAGEKFEPVCGFSKALQSLENIAKRRGVDLRAARQAYLAAVELESATIAEKPALVVSVAAPVKVAQTVTAAPRCSFYKSIKRAYAIAKDAGLDVKADAEMRAAFAAFLGRSVPTRETLGARDWLLVGDAIKSKRLAW